MTRRTTFWYSRLRRAERGLGPAGLALLALAVATSCAEAQEPELRTTIHTLEEMADKQVVLETSEGTIVLAVLPEAAPNHAGTFMERAERGEYDGTTFHSMVRYGIIQGGDPLSVDPGARERYGTGGLRQLAAEPNAERHTRGAVSAVLIPGDPDSAGAQFFITVTDQPSLDGKHTVFARVVEGMDVVERISETPVDESGRAIDRVEIRSARVRTTPPPEVPPYSTESLEELAGLEAVLETSLGEIRIRPFADRAEQHVRHFLRLIDIGAYDGVAFHRVVPGFVVQGGSMQYRSAPLTSRQLGYVTTLEPEFSETPHVRGIVSLARGDDPASGSTSFFICTGPAPSLDGAYTAFGEVVSGFEVLDAMESVPLTGEEPVVRIEIVSARVDRSQ